MSGKATWGTLAGTVLTVGVTMTLAGCDRPQISQSELGRVSFELPDNPELQQNYLPRELPEGADIHDMNISQEKFAKLLGLPDEQAKKFAAPGMSLPPSTPTSPTPAPAVTAPEKAAPEKTETPESSAQGFEILTDDEEPAETPPETTPPAEAPATAAPDGNAEN